MQTKQRIKQITKWLTGIILLVICVMGIRCFCVQSYCIFTQSMEEALHQGDYVLAKKLLQPHTIERNQVMLFTSPLKKDSLRLPLLISRCVALPGDTIQVAENGYSLVVPQKDKAYQLTPVSLMACKEAILSETNGEAVFRNGKLYLNGCETNFFFFKQDYYWMLSDNVNEGIDSRHVGFVSFNHLIGRVWFCWFSKDIKRMFKLVH